MDFKKLLLLNLMVGSLKETEAAISITPTPQPTFATFPPVGPLKSYILVTPRGINPVENLTYGEQAVTSFHPYAISPYLNYLLVETDERIAEKLIGTKFLNSGLPILTEVSVNNQKFCPVKIDEDSIVFAIGSLQDPATMAAATAVGVSETVPGGAQHMFAYDYVVTSTLNSPVKLYNIANPGFVGSEIFVYVYNGNIGTYTTLSTLESFDVVGAFAEVLKLAKLRKPNKTSIIYSGDRSNALVTQLIATVNTTTPVFANLEDALNNIRSKFFKTKEPNLQLDISGCPIGKLSAIEVLKLTPFTCSNDFPIHGITTGDKDYGMVFTVKYTNRWFALKVATMRTNGSIANFSIKFGKSGLVIEAEHGSEDTIARVDQLPIASTTVPRPITFRYKGLIASKEYDIKFEAEEFKFGLSSTAAQVAIRKKGADSFKTIAIFTLHGQPQSTKFCGFSP